MLSASSMRSFTRYLPVLLVAVLIAVSHAGMAQDRTGSASGLPLPRFVTVGAAPVNVRVGPGTNYPIAWTFLKPRMPVEVIEEFDTWRQIRDVEGDTGWVHQSLLSGDRTGITRPRDGQTALRVSADGQSAIRAWLTAGLQVSIRRCTGTVCEISLAHQQGGGTTTYRGFIAQADLYGAYAGEVFD